MDHYEPRAQQQDDSSLAPRRTCATPQLTGLRRLARGGFWVGVVVSGVALAGCSSSPAGPGTGVGRAAKVVFIAQPSSAAAGAALTPGVQVAVQDAQGNTLTTATTSITVAIGTNPASGTLSGTTIVAAVKGVATFSTLSLSTAGSGYTLTASATGLTGATSNAFTISLSVGPAAKLVFTVQPSNVTPGAAITPAMQVLVQDAQGNTVTTATATITVAIGTNPASGTLAGATTLAAVNGVATFANVSINNLGTGYTLTVSATTLTGATSSSFNVIAPITVGRLRLSAGFLFTCGVTTSGVAYCWGNNGVGELGNGTTTNTATTPVAVSGGLSFATVSASGSYGDACGVTTSGAAYCWGLGALGNGSTTLSRTPVAVSGGLSFATVSVGLSSACGVTTSGVAYCWGDNSLGELGNGDTTYSATPVAVSGGLSFGTITAGGWSTCGVTIGGAAYCWGTGSLGNDTANFGVVTPLAVSGGLSFATVSSGVGQVCGATTGGAAYCWGGNDYGELGNGSTTFSPTPVAVSGGLSFATVSSGSSFTCGVTTGGAAFCWGYNADGELGNGTTTNSATPVAVSGGLSFATVSAGSKFACGVTTGGAAYCWGSNVFGQFGNGSTTNSLTPVAVLGGLLF